MSLGVVSRKGYWKGYFTMLGRDGGLGVLEEIYVVDMGIGMGVLKDVIGEQAFYKTNKCL